VATLWIALAMLGVLAALAAWGYAASGLLGVAAACIAVALCGTTAAGALWIASNTSGKPTALHGLLVSIALRTAVPLAIGAILHFRVAALGEANLLVMVLVAYLAGLAVETVLALRLLARGQIAAKAS
jgi:hypothetical protein